MRISFLVVLLLPIVLFGCRVATIVPIESGIEGNDPAVFDAVVYVDNLWQRDVPDALAGAVDLTELLPAYTREAKAAGERWGRSDGSGKHHLIVRGEGRVIAVDVAFRTGIAELEIAVPDGAETVRLQIGPVLRGTSIRDALPSVSFDQFVNQIEYADVANELNARVERELLASLDRETLEGRQLGLTGMVTLDGDGPLIITPIRLELGGAS